MGQTLLGITCNMLVQDGTYFFRLVTEAAMSLSPYEFTTPQVKDVTPIVKLNESFYSLRWISNRHIATECFLFRWLHDARHRFQTS